MARRARNAFREGEAPTPAQFAAGYFVRHYDTRLAHNDQGQARGWRRQRPIERWHRDGWITAEQARNLTALDNLHERACAALTHVRSCCDTSPVGYRSRGGLPEHLAAAVLAWEAACRRLRRALDGDFDLGMQLMTDTRKTEALYAALWPAAGPDTRRRNARAIVHKLATAA